MIKKQPDEATQARLNAAMTVIDDVINDQLSAVLTDGTTSPFFCAAFLPDNGGLYLEDRYPAVTVTNLPGNGDVLGRLAQLMDTTLERVKEDGPDWVQCPALDKSGPRTVQ
jgi:hypothetical protein